MTIKLVKMSRRNVFSFLELTILLSSVFVLQLSSAVAHKSYSPDFIDVTILDVNASINETYRGATIHVFVTVEATWDVFDFSSFWVAAFYDGSLIDMETIIVLYNGHEIFTFNFAWNTSGVEIGSYIISAMTSTSIMPYIDGQVQILPVGNINTKQGYSTIQEAINNASKGDTIFASSGTYYENVVVNKTISLIGEDRDTTIIDGNKTGTVINVNANDVVISGFSIRNSNQSAGTSYAGIKISGQGCNVTANHITKNKIGIFVTSEKSMIKENTVVDNGQGIALYDSSEVMVEANDVSANTVGISLAFSSNNIIVGNRAVNSSFGGHGMTLLSNSFNNTIENNEFTGNFHGMWLSSSFNNRVANNTIANNELLGIELSRSSGNTFSRNNIVGNPTPVRVDTGKPNESICIWDNGCEGNYWSNYNGTDSDGDGIGDTPHIINGNNTDRYPLMNPYWLPGDVNHDLKIDIYDVVRITGIYNSQQGDPNWNCHSDIAEPYGIINIYDVVTCTKDYRKEYTT